MSLVSQFRYLPVYVKIGKNQLIFSPSGLCEDCPLQYYFTLNIKKELTKEVKEIFDKGNDIHDREVVLNKGARCVINAEDKMKIIHNELGYVVSARYDHLKFDFEGRYLEDYKTCQGESIPNFFIEPIPKKHVVQLSIYAFVFYINTGILITRGVITKIDKDKPRNRGSREFELMSMEDIEKYIVNHPTILHMTGQKDFEYLKSESETNIKSYDCTFCSYVSEHQAIVEFPINENLK